MSIQQAIKEGKTSLGIELGSTRIKAVLIGEDYSSITAGSHEWENRLEDGIWTYSLEDVWTGLQHCIRDLLHDVQNRYDLTLTSVGAIGISAMMHGYLVFDKGGNLLVPFRTWRNTITEKAASILTEKLQCNIPQRWSIAHLYQAGLNGEPHIKDIDFMTSLAGYVHWKLTGQKVLGLCDASGVFPVDSTINTYDAGFLRKFDELISPLGLGLETGNILPRVLCAGEKAGILTEEGARLLDPSGCLKAGIPLCPPEGDAGTGMIATNAIKECTGTISAGTSIFAITVLEKKLSTVYPDIDIVVTPAGKPAAIVHGNNGSSDIDAWVRLFNELLDLTKANVSVTALYDALYHKALEADDDCGGMLSYNYYAGEHITGIEEGRPLFVRMPDSNFTLANFMRTLLFSALGSLKIGMNILVEKEKIRINSIIGHGGLFKTKGVMQRFMAAALNTPVTVMEESAGEGGAWGIALLAAFILHGNTSLEQFLAEKVFVGKTGTQIKPDPKDVESFKIFIDRYADGLTIEQAAGNYLKRG